MAQSSRVYPEVIWRLVPPRPRTQRLTCGKEVDHRRWESVTLDSDPGIVEILVG